MWPECRGSSSMRPTTDSGEINMDHRYQPGKIIPGYLMSNERNGVVMTTRRKAKQELNQRTIATKLMWVRLNTNTDVLQAQLWPLLVKFALAQTSSNKL